MAYPLAIVRPSRLKRSEFSRNFSARRGLTMWRNGLESHNNCSFNGNLTLARICGSRSSFWRGPNKRLGVRAKSITIREKVLFFKKKGEKSVLCGDKYTFSGLGGMGHGPLSHLGSASYHTNSGFQLSSLIWRPICLLNKTYLDNVPTKYITLVTSVHAAR